MFFANVQNRKNIQIDFSNNLIFEDNHFFDDLPKQSTIRTTTR